MRAFSERSSEYVEHKELPGVCNYAVRLVSGRRSACSFDNSILQHEEFAAVLRLLELDSITTGLCSFVAIRSIRAFMSKTLRGNLGKRYETLRRGEFLWI